MDINKNLSETHPDGWQGLTETEAYKAGVVVTEDQNAYKAVTTLGEDVGAMVLGGGHLRPVVGDKEGPVGGAWPAIVVRGRVVGGDGEPIESTLLGMQGTIIVPDTPGSVFQLIDACLCIVLTHEQMEGVSSLVRSMYSARARQNEEDPSQLQPTVLEEQLIKAQESQSGALAAAAQEAMDQLPDGLRELLQAIMQAGDEAKNDENTEDIN